MRINGGRKIYVIYEIGVFHKHFGGFLRDCDGGLYGKIGECKR